MKKEALAMERVERSLTFDYYSLGTVQTGQETAQVPNRGSTVKGTETGIHGSREFIKRKTHVRLEMF